MAKSYLVTGGTGFIGSSMVRRLIRDGHRIRILDNNSRGALRRIKDIPTHHYEFVAGDIRDAGLVNQAADGMEGIIHLAYVNGTNHFYTSPELVLDVGVRGMLNVLDACRHHKIRDLVLASSSEVYQTPDVIPTPEDVSLSIPDPLNPRYSYGGGKIICELMAINYGRTGFDRVCIFRPHNVYGPDMGWEHVLPQFVVRMKELVSRCSDDPLTFPIQGTGRETRSFIHIDDFVEGVMAIINHGLHQEIYHVGTEDEVSISRVAEMVGEYFGRRLQLMSGEAPAGATARRCPDIRKLRSLGFAPEKSLREGITELAEWYCSNSTLQFESSQESG